MEREGECSLWGSSQIDRARRGLEAEEEEEEEEVVVEEVVVEGAEEEEGFEEEAGIEFPLKPKGIFWCVCIGYHSLVNQFSKTQ